MKKTHAKKVWFVALAGIALLVSACGLASASSFPARDLVSYCIRFTRPLEDSRLPLREETVSYCFLFTMAREEGAASLRSASNERPRSGVAIGEVFPVDPLFEEFYAYFGGMKTLGPAITPLTEADGKMRQYVQAGLMEYDGQAVQNDRFRLAPLGAGFGLKENGIKVSEGGDRVVAGYSIHPEFLAMYEQMGGARFVGRPLTGPRHNADMERIEQYFENLGFYRSDYDPPDTVRLLAYGAFACDQRCRYQAPSASILGLEAALPEPFASRVAQLGAALLGRTLTPVYQAPDGQPEVIFENLVLTAGPEGVAARPIVELVGIKRRPAVPCAEDALMSCYLLEIDKGHNVPRIFTEFLAQYGWLEFSGLPITEVFSEKEGIFRQCFDNLCVDFDVNAGEEQPLRLAPLGVAYMQEYYAQPEPESFINSQSLENVRIEVWEAETYIATDQAQEINVAIFQNNVPLANREPVITVTMPDNSQEVHPFPPTGENGKTSLTLPAIQAPSGTLIAYQVCLPGLQESQCVTDHYLIWNYP